MAEAQKMRTILFAQEFFCRLITEKNELANRKKSNLVGMNNPGSIGVAIVVHQRVKITEISEINRIHRTVTMWIPVIQKTWKRVILRCYTIFLTW